MTTQTLAPRIVWTQAMLARTIELGRSQGWVDGDPAHARAWVSLAELENALENDQAAPLVRAGERLGLARVELDALWLLACIEIEPVLWRLARELMRRDRELSVQVLQRIVAPPTQIASDALTLDAIARLESFGLVDVAGNGRDTLAARSFRARDRVIDLANGEWQLDRELHALASLDALEVAEPDLPRSLRAAALQNARIVITGAAGTGRAALARRALRDAGHATVTVRCPELARDESLCARQLRAVARECRIFGVAPVLVDLDRTGHVDVIERELVRSVLGPVAITARELGSWQLGRPLVAHQLVLPSSVQRAVTWSAAIPGASAECVERASAAFNLSHGMITRVASSAVTHAGGDGSNVTDDHIREALRGELDHRVRGLATRIEGRQNWGDLVLPADQVDQLVELVARVRHRQQVIETWGFGDKVGKGLGTTALLSGPPGTGKTMVAGLVASELGLDLYQVDLSRIVSKWLGETEKQLANLFDAAETGHAILLFDEADSLFGRRTEVRSSNDRYANLEVNYLLQRMESFAGICMLTTNHESAIDEAFRRRLSIHIRFPVPDETQRAELWRVMLPERAARTADIDHERLAREFAMSGGHIKNAVVRAAFLAADEGGPIAMRHLSRAARAEYEALGKIARGLEV